MIRRQFQPLGRTRELQRARGARARAHVARGDQRHRLPAVVQLKLRWRPDQIAQIDRRLDHDLGDGRERHPAVAPLDHGFDHRAKARIGIGDPLERLAVERAGRGRRALKRLGTQPRSASRIAARLRLQCLHQPRDPGLRLPERDRRGLSREHGLTNQLALQRLAVGVDHRQRGRVELAAHLELRRCALPLAEHAQQLEQEHAQLCVGRVLAHLAL